MKSQKKEMQKSLIEKLQIDMDQYSELTPQQIINERNKEYLSAGELERAVMFGSANATLVHKEATMLQMVNDISKVAEFTSDTMDNINSIKYLVKVRFSEVFPDFDDNAAIALGIRISNAFKRVKSDELAIYREGTFEWVINHIMQGIREGRSNNRFFVRLRRNFEKMELFKEELRSYIRNRWDAEMMKSNTFHNSMVDMYKLPSDDGDEISKTGELAI